MSIHCLGTWAPQLPLRTYRFAVLGMALANQFDVKEPQDLLRGLSNVLTEYDLLKEETDKSRIVRFIHFLAYILALQLPRVSSNEYSNQRPAPNGHWARIML